MKCIVCRVGSLEIVNSRKHQTELRVWRRRRCRRCATVFTTRELPDYDGAFTITNPRQHPKRRPFDKASLLARLFASGGHLPKQADLFWLAETIAAKAFVAAAEHDYAISHSEYHLIATNVLQAYDTLLSANFEARTRS